MIGQPFKHFHVLGDKFFTGNRNTLLELFVNDPRFVEGVLWDKSWFFILDSEVDFLESILTDFKFRKATKVFNKIKLEIFSCFIENNRNYTLPIDEDWDYLVYFNKNYNSLFEDYIYSEYNTSLNWIIEDGEIHEDLDKTFEKNP